MATSSELFQELKKQATDNYIELSLTAFDESFSQIKDLFSDLVFDIGNISILTSTENQLKIKAYSKDFLFSKTVFKNESVLIEATFTLVNDKIEMLAICKLNKTPNKLSKLPGIIGELLKPLDFLEITNLVYIITTKDISIINSETFPEYHNKSVNFKSGINLAGFIDLKNSGNVVSLITKPLKPVIGEGPYFMSWNMRDKVDIDFRLNLPQDIAIENLFRLKQPKLVIKPINPVQISIDGLFEIQLPPLIKVSVLGGFSFTPDGVRGKFNLDKVAEKVPAPFGYPGVHLTTLTVSAGISNAVANIGAEGNFYIGPNKQDSISNKPKVAEFGIASNQYKFIFDAVPGKITPRFFYMYLDTLTLEEYLKALTNQNINLPSFLNKISMEQLMFHWCETPTGETKPDGTIGMPVFGLSGISNVFGHRTFTELNVAESNESKGILVADPIDIGKGLLKITGNGKGTPEKYRGATKVKPGGMQFIFNSNGNPSYLSLSAKIEILGLSGEITGEVKDNGINGNVKSNIPGILKNELGLNLNGSNFDAVTEIYTGISGLKVSLGSLGTIKLDTYLEGGFNAKYLNGKYTNKMKLHFMLVGVNFDLGEIEIEVPDLKKIVKILENEIIKAAQRLTENILAWLTATIEELITFVGDKLESIGKALNETYKRTLEDSAKLMKEVGYQAKQVGEALHKGFNKTGQELANALRAAGYLAEEVGEVLKDVVQLAGEAAADVLKRADYTIEEIGRTLKNVYGFGDQKVAQILKSIGATAEEIAKVLRDVFNLGAEQVGILMKAIGYAAEMVARALKFIGEPVAVVHKVLVNIFQQPDEAARKVLEVVGFPVKVITDQLPHLKVHLPHVKSPIHIKNLPHLKSPVHLKKPW